MQNEIKNESVALQYVEFNATRLVANTRDGFCANLTKEKYAKALNLLVSLFDMTLTNVKCIDDESKRDERELRYRVSSTEKLELIKLITEL
jgi:hypothetical protein